MSKRFLDVIIIVLVMVLTTGLSWSVELDNKTISPDQVSENRG